jgi:hypothetical protein
MKLRSTMIALLGLGMVVAPAFAAETARPGTVNYVEGAAYLEGRQLNAQDVGTINLEPGQILTTGAGKAEVLLTPGVFLRLDDNSAVKMISPDLTLTQVELEKGRAGIEVDEIHDQNNLQVLDAGVTTRLEKMGYYEFSATNPTAMVFKGKASVEAGNGKTREIKEHHELALTGENGRQVARVKPADFDTHAQDELYNWSSLRSQYLAEANNEMAGAYAGAGYYPGWYWDPGMYGYTFIGGGPFYSPFGWGFYPFGWGGFYGGYYGGYYGRGFHGHGGYDGGFHGGEGFHGGGMGGGFHGGGGGRR